MVLLSYTTYIRVNLAHHDIFRPNVGKGGIIFLTQAQTNNFQLFHTYF